jgi:peptidoglycan/xylan/chitin deacetylase (PgdA/CDA1 family)
VFDRRPIVGTSLPLGTLCLTFDDGPGTTPGTGPGPKTQRLAEYLADQEVPATFFVCGKHVAELPDVVGRVRALGHVVANHTQTHPDLAAALESGGDVVGEVAGTDALIREGASGRLFFRPPYGSWSGGVADALNADAALAARYVGPINWDVDADDWACWRDGISPSVCAANYLGAVEGPRRGIVLMHDSTADNDTWKQANASFEMVQVLVPALQRRGYRFAAVDEVPDVRAAIARTA